MKKFNVSGVVSNTALSKFNIEEKGSPKLFKLFIDGWRDDIKSPAMEIGSLIHSYYEDPTRISKMEFVKPSDSIKKWADDFMEKTNDKELTQEEEDEIILQSKIDVNVFGGTKKKETILKKFGEAQEYINFVKDKEKNKDKIIVSSSEYNHLLNAIHAVNENDLARKLLDEGNKEFRLIFKRMGIEIKAIIDNLQINDDDKKIYVTDIKVTNCRVNEILTYFSDRNYDRQLSLYREAIVGLVKSNNVPDYEIECYIVNISLSDKKSLVLKVSEKTLIEGREKHDKLLAQIKEHKEEGYWEGTLEEKKKGFVEL